jgi:hypothetical protein
MIWPKTCLKLKAEMTHSIPTVSLEGELVHFRKGRPSRRPTFSFIGSLIGLAHIVLTRVAATKLFRMLSLLAVYVRAW